MAEAVQNPKAHDAHKSSHGSQSVFVRSVIDIVGGTVGGIGLVLVGHPFDTLKVRLQTQSHTNPLYNGTVDCAKKIYKAEGLGGFYKGVASPLWGQMFFNAVQFMAYGNAKSIVSGLSGGAGPNNDLTIKQYFAAGALTGFTVAFIEGPIDLFKTQLQTAVFKEKPAYNSFVGCVSYITKHHGFAGWYQGILPTVCRNVPAVASYFGAYEYARRKMAGPSGAVAELSPLSVLSAGALGGAAYWTTTYPIDVIKSSIQADSTVKSERRFKGLVDCGRQLYAEGGVARFFPGIAPCLLRSLPANAVCFFLYEKTVQVLNKSFGAKH